MGSAESELAHQELSLVAINLFQFHVRAVRRLVDVVGVKIPHNKEVRSAGFGGEMVGGRRMPLSYTDPGLPAGAKVVFTAIHGYVEIGIELCGSNPVAIEAEASRRFRRALEIRVVLQEIDQRLPGVRCSGGMFGAIGGDVPFYFLVSTTRRDRLRGRKSLGEREGRESRKKQRDQELRRHFHGWAPALVDRRNGLGYGCMRRRQEFQVCMGEIRCGGGRWGRRAPLLRRRKGNLPCRLGW